MQRDTYEIEWKAKRGTWNGLLYNLERAKDDALYRQQRYESWVRYYGKQYADERMREEDAYEARQLARRLERQARDERLIPLLHSLSPVNEWVGAAWVTPEGNLYPVRYCNHQSRAEQIAPHVFPAEVKARIEHYGYCDCAEFLSERKGWLRIGADGLVGDHAWNRVKEMSQGQLDAISNMLARGKVRGASDYSETSSFVNGLEFSVRYALGEINERGETPEEAKARHELYAQLRAEREAYAAQRNAANREFYEAVRRSRRSQAAKRGWETRRARAAYAVRQLPEVVLF